MLRHVCPNCKMGSHKHCWGTKHPPEGYMGGSTCVCKHELHETRRVHTFNIPNVNASEAHEILREFKRRLNQE